MVVRRVAEVVIFALSKVFRRFSARDDLALRRLRADSLGTDGLDHGAAGTHPAQILHCGTFTVCHLAAMRYIAARQGSRSDRLQAVYSAVAMGGSIAIATVFAGFLYQHLHPGRLLVMALLAPGDGYTAKSGRPGPQHGADMLLLAFSEVVLRVDQRRRKQRQRRIGGDDSVTPLGTFLLKALYALVFDIQRQQR